MAKPPETPPHSDIEGVNRDARSSMRLENGDKDPGTEMNKADSETPGRPEGGRQADEEPDAKEP